MGVPLLLGLVHVGLIAPWYHVGSFDDDAGYILGARAIAAGQGLTAHLRNGTTLAGSTPPGYSAALSPLVLVFGGDEWWPMRALSVLCFAAAFPLLWVWLGRRGAPDVVRVGALVLWALNPVAATFGSMVMAEMPFVAVLLVLLLALDGEGRRAAVVAVAAAVALLWLKEAGVGVDVGVVVWLWARRQWGKGAWLATTVALSLAPVLIARVVAGVPLAGSRYSQELGAYYGGGIEGRITHVLPAALHQAAAVALPASVVPRGAPLWPTGWEAHLLRVLAWQVTVLTVVGFVRWVRRSRDVTVVAVPVYLLEALLWPYVNERRFILVLPVLLAWYALGVVDLGRALLRWWRGWGVPYGALVAAVVVAPLVAQAPRDYLFAIDQPTSEPQGSRYMALLSAGPGPRSVIDTDYTSTTALFSGHDTAEGAFIADNPLASVLRCVPPAQDRADLLADRAGWVLTGDLNKAHVTDNPCILDAATTQPWAVRLLRTQRDAASVFELIGPGTVHPDLVDLTAGVAPTGVDGSWQLASQGRGDHPGTAPEAGTVDGVATVTWSWGAPSEVAQVSVGGARSLTGATTGVSVELDEGGRWVVVATSAVGVGDGTGLAPYLLWCPGGPGGTAAAGTVAAGTVAAGTVAASGVRVVVDGSGQVAVVDLHVLGRVGPP